MYLGDVALGSTLDFTFTTRSFATGAPTQLAGTPAISAYVDNGTTELTAGITLTVDFDSRTGLNHVRAVLSAGNGYAAGTNISFVITAGTVGGVSVVGEVVGQVSIEARSALMPDVAGRKLSVTSGNLAEVNVVEWDGDSLVPTNIPGVPVVDLEAITGDTQSATDLKDFADAGYDPATNKVQGVVLVDTLTTYTGNTPQTGDSFARLGAPAGASVSADIAAVKAQTAAIEVDTQNLQSRLPAALVGGRIDASVGAVAAGVIVAASFGAGAFDAVWTVADRQLTDFSAAFKTGYAIGTGGIAASAFAAGAIDAAALATDAANEIATAVWAAGTRTLSAFGFSVTVGTNNDKTGYALSTAGVDAIWDDAVDGAVTARQSLRLANSALGGILAGAATTTITIRDLADTKDRITATVDASGNRTVITLDLT